MSFLTPTWGVIDAAAWDDDKPLHSALLQRAAINGHYIQRHHTRSTSIGYDHGFRPIMCGAIPPGETSSQFERVCIPYLWQPNGATSIDVTVSYEMFIPSGTGTFVLDVFWQELRDFTSPPLRNARVPLTRGLSDGAKTISSTGDGMHTFVLDISERSPGQNNPIIIWVTGKSSETSTGASQGGLSSLERIRGRTIETDPTLRATAITNDAQPELVVYLFDDASNESTILPRRRQVIRMEEGISDDVSDDVIYTWPFYPDPRPGELTTIKNKADPLPEFRPLTSLKLYGVLIEDQTPLLPDYGSKFNAGQGPGHVAAKELYLFARDPFLSRTPPHAIGSVADTTVLDDFVSLSTVPVSNVYPSVKVTSAATWFDVSSAYLQHRNSFQPPDDPSDDVVIGVHVRALVVMLVPPSTERLWDIGYSSDRFDVLDATGSLDVSFRLKMSSETGSADDDGAAVEYKMLPLGHNSWMDARNDPDNNNRFASLVDMQRGVSDDTFGWDGSNANAHAHTLFGALPESSWADCAATYIDLYVTDGSSGQRLCTLQANILLAPIENVKIQLVTWLVTDTEYTDETNVEGVN